MYVSSKRKNKCMAVCKKKVFHLTDTEYEKFIYQLNARNSSEFFRKLFKAIFRAQCKYYIHIHTCTLRGRYDRKYNRRLLSAPHKKNEFMSKTKLLNKTFWQRFGRVCLDVALTQVRRDTFICRTKCITQWVLQK